MEFERYAVRIEAKEVQDREVSPRTRPFFDLLKESQPKEAKAELLWRLGLLWQRLICSSWRSPLRLFMRDQVERIIFLCVAYLYAVQQFIEH